MATNPPCAEHVLQAIFLVVLGERAQANDPCDRPAVFATTLKLNRRDNQPVGELTVYLCEGCDRSAQRYLKAEYVKPVRLRRPEPAPGVDGGCPACGHWNVVGPTHGEGGCANVTKDSRGFDQFCGCTGTGPTPKT